LDGVQNSDQNTEKPIVIAFFGVKMPWAPEDTGGRPSEMPDQKYYRREKEAKSRKKKAAKKKLRARAEAEYKRRHGRREFSN
jgi:hypothetical protein